MQVAHYQPGGNPLPPDEQEKGWARAQFWIDVKWEILDGDDEKTLASAVASFREPATRSIWGSILERWHTEQVVSASIAGASRSASSFAAALNSKLRKASARITVATYHGSFYLWQEPPGPRKQFLRHAQLMGDTND